jgi:hypothetical protein
MIASACAFGSSGGTAKPQPVSRTTWPISPTSLATTGRPAAIASISLVGRAGREALPWVAWMGIHATRHHSRCSVTSSGGTRPIASTRPSIRPGSPGPTKRSTAPAVLTMGKAARIKSIPRWRPMPPM